MSKNTELKFKYKLTEAEKYKNDKQVAKEVMDELIPHFSKNWVKDYNNMLANYKLYNNDITQEDFERVCNPLGIDIGSYSEDVLPYNKTYQKIDVLLGEELKRGFNFTLTLLNPKAIEQKDNELKNLYKQYIQEVVEKEINVAQLMAQGVSQEEAEKTFKDAIASKTPAEIEDITFLSELEILGNDLLQYGIYYEDIQDKKNDGFKHALLSDTEVVYVGLEKGEPKIKILNSIQVFGEKDQEEKYMQNGDWAGHRTIMSVQRALELYGDQLKGETKERLEKKLPGNKNPAITGELKVNRDSTLTNRFAKQIHNEEYLDDEIGSYSTGNDSDGYSAFQDYVTVVTVEWKWLREIKFLTFRDDYGDEQTDIVDSSYPVPDYATKVEFTNKFGDSSIKYEWTDEMDNYFSIESLWIPRVWEGVRIDEDIYPICREKPNQILDMDNPYLSKLGYHGITFNSMNAKPISMMGRMKPFQFLFFVILHQIKELIPKHIGPIQNFDVSMVDPNLAKVGGDPEADAYSDALSKTLFYRQKGLNIYNSMINNVGGEARETNVSRPQPGSVENMSVAGDLNNLISLLGWVDEQIGLAAGVSKQREAQFSSNTNVTDNQQAITQSSHITEHYFRKHNALWKEVLQSYLNYAKIAWKGKNMKKEFILQDGSLKTLEIKESSFDNANFGLFITNTGRHEEYNNKMEELALSFIQNEGSIEQVSYILKARAHGTSPEEIHKEIIKIQRRQEAKQEAAQKAEMESKEKLIQMEIDAREDVQEHEIQLKRMEIEGKLAVAEVTAFMGQADQDINDNNVPDQLEIEKLRFENSKLNTEVSEKAKDRDLKREEMLAKERIENKKISAIKNKPSSK